MECDFIPISYDNFDYEGENYIQITGRASNRERICVIDKFESSFWIILKENISQARIDELIGKIKNINIEDSRREIKVINIEIHDKKYLGKDVKALKVFSGNYKDLHEIASGIGDDDIILYRREYDINIITKYLMEKELLPLKNFRIKGEVLSHEDLGGIINILDCDNVIYLESFEEIQSQDFHPSVLAYDIETENIEIGKSRILMISLYSENFSKVLTCEKNKSELDFVEFYESEQEMLESFVKYIKKLSPDIVCGYFSDGFDLPYIRARARENKIDLNIGVDNTTPVFSKGRIPSGKINGIVHVDLYKFISSVFSQYLQTESLSLNEVAKELIGEGKRDFDFGKLSNMEKQDWIDFFEYNLQDSKITYNLFQAVWPDMYELSLIVKEPLYNISRNTMASNCENYILHNLKKFNEIAEKKPTKDMIAERIRTGRYEGAYVLEPKPNLYEKIVLFDFTSMYASIIVTYNLSKSTYNGENFDVSPKGFFPILLEEIILKRKEFKKEYNENRSNLSRARSNAYKLLANASYGYLGFSVARYYSKESAQATTRYAKERILSTIEEIEKEGYEIIYSDTDSIAFLQGDKSEKEIFNLLKKLNDKLPGIMELDFEDFYNRGLFVSKRADNRGAKKKYALLKRDKTLKIRGFETVRRDWCYLARNLQREIIEAVLLDGDERKAMKLFNETVEKLKDRKVLKKDLLLRVQLKKEIGNYKTISPHVVAAEKMKNKGIQVTPGMIIEYYIGEYFGKSKKISDKVFLVDEDEKYDIDYYLNNQIIPAVENIFEVFYIDIKRKLNKQKSLLDFK